MSAEQDLPAQDSPAVVSMRLTAQPEPDIAGQFLRTWRVSGPDVCRALREAGIETSDWRLGSMRSTSYECYFQRIYRQNEARPLSSTFLKIKGNARGDIFEVRGKILGPKLAEDGGLDPSLMRIFEILVEQVRWTDLKETLLAVRAMRDVDYQRFGTSFSFGRDADGQDGYTFALVLSADAGPQARTRLYFAADRWVRLPDPMVSAELMPTPKLALK